MGRKNELKKVQPKEAEVPDSHLLFLDDIRNPQDVGEYIYPVELRLLYNFKEWKVVRNYEDFVSHINFSGLPAMISFDHDLGEDVAREKVENGISKRKAREEKKAAKTGHDCAKWLVEFCLNNHKSLPDFLVHSMNPVGAKNIKDLLENFKKFQESQKT